jgi:hypothetical protein
VNPDRDEEHPNPETAAAQARIWRVNAVLLVPKYAPMAPDGGFPEQLEFQSRMPEQARTYGDITVAIRKLDDESYKNYSAVYVGNNPEVEPVQLLADVRAGSDETSALERLGPTFETLIDLLAFEMGTPLGVGQMNVTDITPPVSTGEERPFSSFTGSPFDRNARAVEMQAIQGRLLGQLPECLEVQDPQAAAVLRWFVKGLGTNVLHDQFIFLWIALEILCDASDVQVLKPYVGRCGHEIANCPECQKPTPKIVRGATLRAFLERFGVSEEQAQELWEMRQLMHGAIPFDSAKLTNLGALVQSLRAVVAAGLKGKLGKLATDPPIVAASGLSIHPTASMGGTGQIAESDLQPLI